MGKASGPAAPSPPLPSATDRPGRLRSGIDWRRLVILATVAALIAGAVYLVVGSISGGLTVLGVFRVLGITAGLALVIGAVMAAIGARMRGRRGAG
ncbi:MAG: hypothetical protein ACXVHC_07330 [Frankiaceae bacterium]